MKILFLTRFFYPHIGGVEKHVYEVGKRLLEKGHTVTIITEKITFTRTSVYQSNDESDKLMGKIQQFRIYKVPVGEETWFKKFRIWKWLWQNRYLLQDADVIHCHDIFFWYLPFTFIHPTKKVFLTFHGYEGNTIPGFKAKFWHKIGEILTNGNICVGSFYKKWYGTVATKIIYGGTNLPSQRQDISKKIKEAVFIGRLEEETSIMQYLQAMNLLKKDRRTVKLTILGDGSLRKKAEEFVKKYNLPVTFQGFVNDTEQYITKSDIVFASRYLAILEAFAHKKYVIAHYNSPIKKDYLQMTPFANWITIASNSKEIAQQIREYTKNLDQIKKKITLAYEWVENQKWDDVVSIYENLWRGK